MWLYWFLLPLPLALHVGSLSSNLSQFHNPRPTTPPIVAAPTIYPVVSLPPSLSVGYSGLEVRLLGVCEASVRVKKASPLKLPSFLFPFPFSFFGGFNCLTNLMTNKLIIAILIVKHANLTAFGYDQFVVLNGYNRL